MRPRPQRVIAASIDGDPVDLATLSLDGRALHCSSGWGVGVISVAYEHGYSSPPEPVSRAAVKLAAAYVESGDDRISRFREDDQEVWLSVAGSGGETGLPEVDSVIRSYGHHSVVF